jgi:hypothetical protein
MILRPRRQRGWRFFAVAVLAALASLTLTDCASGPSSSTAPPTNGSATAAPTAAAIGAGGHITLAADRKLVREAETSARALVGAPGMPTCAPPPLPAATYPPGHSYGIPFLAAVTDGQIITGYDEWTANHRHWKAGGKTYILDPWQSRVYDITGWVSGLLQLPSLSASVPPRDLVFCDTGAEACVSASPPAGDCIHVSLGGAPTPGTAPSTPITNNPPKGHACFGAPSCVPYLVKLTPVGDTLLTVDGVNSQGELQLSVTTSAKTEVALAISSSFEITCENGVTTVTLTSHNDGVPPGGPTPPTRGNLDLRGLRIPPTALQGPLGSATTTLASNDFSVPAFSNSACPSLAPVFDSPLAGWNALPSQDSASQNNNYFDKNPLPAIAGTPGWVQFSATTTVSDLGLPVGPPSGFSLNP